jgi:hypothetical protein
LWAYILECGGKCNATPLFLLTVTVKALSSQRTSAVANGYGGTRRSGDTARPLSPQSKFATAQF